TASEFGIPEEFAGSVVISGRYENNLPAPIVMSVTQIGASHYSNDFGRTHGDNRITLPRLFKSFDEGSGELSSTIYITNVNPDNPTPVTLNLYDDKTCYIRNFSLGPYAMAAINVDMDSDLPKNTVFSGVLTYSDAAIIASEISWVEGTAGLHTGYSGLVIDVNQVSLPRLIRHPDQYSVIRIFNAGSSTADLTLRFLDFNGNSVLEYPITNLPSLGLKRIKLINLPGLPANFEGSGLVEISTPDSDIGVVVDEYLPNGHGFLDLPITYENHHSLAIQNFDDNGRITAWFDHNLPNYDNNQEIIIYDGRNLKSSAKLEFDSFQELFYFEDSNRHQYYYDGHNGNDFNGGRISILASGDGVVIQAGCGAYGNQIIIDHGNGYYTLYGHLSEINVSRGEIVEKKQIIGITGGSGREEGSLICVPNLFRTHLHFGVFKDNGNNIW
ncbi:MAG: M23 family metallopeptidase, partial [Bacillota bacterium]